MTARLPIPGGDDDDWGTILNTYLEVSLSSDGTLNAAALQQVSSNLIDAAPSDIQPLGSQAAGAIGKAADAGHVHPTTGLAQLDGATFTGYVAPTVFSLTYGSSISLNAAQSNVFDLTLTGSGGTIENPTNPLNGQSIRIRIYQDGTGTRTVSWGNAFEWGSAGSPPTLSSVADAMDILGFEYTSVKGKWVYLSAPFPQGF